MYNILKKNDQYGGKSFNTQNELDLYMVDKDENDYLLLGYDDVALSKKYNINHEQFNIDNKINEFMGESKMLDLNLNKNFQYQLDNDLAIKINSSDTRDYYAVSTGFFVSVSKVTDKVKTIKPIWSGDSFYISINNKKYNGGKLMYETFIDNIGPGMYVAFRDNNKKNFSVDNLYLLFDNNFAKTVPFIIWKDLMFPYYLKNVEDVAIKIGTTKNIIMMYLEEGSPTIKGWNYEILDPDGDYEFDEVFSSNPKDYADSELDW